MYFFSDIDKSGNPVDEDGNIINENGNGSGNEGSFLTFNIPASDLTLIPSGAQSGHMTPSKDLWIGCNLIPKARYIAISIIHEKNCNPVPASEKYSTRGRSISITLQTTSNKSDYITFS